MENDRLKLNGIVVFLSDELSYLSMRRVYGNNGKIFNLWILRCFFGRLCFGQFSAIEDCCNTIGVLLTHKNSCYDFGREKGVKCK